MVMRESHTAKRAIPSSLIGFVTKKHHVMHQVYI